MVLLQSSLFSTMHFPFEHYGPSPDSAHRLAAEHTDARFVAWGHLAVMFLADCKTCQGREEKCREEKVVERDLTTKRMEADVFYMEIVQ